MNASHEFGQPTPPLVNSGEAMQALKGQDVILNMPKEGLFGVFDGVGSLSAGAEAAQMTAEILKNGVNADRAPWALPASAAAGWLKNVLTIASKSVEKEFGSDGATTAAVVRTVEEKDGSITAAWASIGDSRVYWVSGNTIHQISTDEGHESTLANWVGKGGLSATQVGTLLCRPGDRIIIVSDGVTGDVGDELLSAEDLKNATDGLNAEAAAQALISAGRKKDDRSALVIDIPDPMGTPKERHAAFTAVAATLGGLAIPPAAESTGNATEDPNELGNMKIKDFAIKRNPSDPSAERVNNIDFLTPGLGQPEVQAPAESTPGDGFSETQLAQMAQLVSMVVPTTLQSMGLSRPVRQGLIGEEDNEPRGDGKAVSHWDFTEKEKKDAAKAAKEAQRRIRDIKRAKNLAEVDALPSADELFQRDMERFQSALEAMRASVPTQEIEVLEPAKRFTRSKFTLEQYTGLPIFNTPEDGIINYVSSKTTQGWLLESTSQGGDIKSYYVVTIDGEVYETTNLLKKNVTSNINGRQAVRGDNNLFAKRLRRALDAKESSKSVPEYVGLSQTPQSSIVERIHNGIAEMEQRAVGL